MNIVRKNIPNFLTSMNILCGCIAVVIAFESRGELSIMIWATLFIGIASIFDFADGFSARALKAYSPMGKELDSLADMISFGFAPSTIMFQLMKLSYGSAMFENSLFSAGIGQVAIVMTAYLIAIFSGIRLAKFNVDTRQSESFVGLATPPNAILIASIPLMLHLYPDLQILRDIFLNINVLIPLTVFLSYMLIAEFPMFSLKFKNLQFRDNLIRYIFLIGTLILLIAFRAIGIALVIIFYILLSAIDNWVLKSGSGQKTTKHD